MKKFISLLLVMVLLLTLLPGCGSKTESTGEQEPSGENGSASEQKTGELVKLRVASLPSQLATSIYFVQKQGWDKENGFEIELTTFPSGAPVNEALGAGLWDVSAIGAAAVQSLCVYDAVQIFAHVDAGAGIEAMVRNDSPILKVKGYNPDFPDVYGDPETVRGATILLPIGSGSHLQISKWLEVIGVKEDEVSLVHMEYPQGYQAFTSGEGDVVATSYPQTPKYYEDGGYTAVSSMQTLKIPYYDNIIVAREFYDNEANKPILVAFLKQLLRAADAFREDEDLYVSTLKEWYSINGKEMSDKDVRDEALMKPFVTTEEAKNFNFGASLKLQASFMASIDKINEDDLKKVEANIMTDILEMALQN